MRTSDRIANDSANNDGVAQARKGGDGAARPDFVQSLERGLAVVTAFDAEHPEMRLNEVAEATGLTRASARRFLLTLVELGYARLANGSFSLTPKVLDLGFAYLSGLSFAEIAEPHLERLVEELKESSSISVLDGLDIIYVVRVPTRRIMTINIAVGTRLPAYATSMGRVLLAALPDEELDRRLDQIELVAHTHRTVASKKALRAELAQVRHAGYAMVDQELEQGLRSAAVPIRDGRGGVAALNVSAHATRVDMDELRDRYVPFALEAAAAIEADVGGRGVAS
jgi:IclR family pca regulon transcriptional regulator